MDGYSIGIGCAIFICPFYNIGRNNKQENGEYERQDVPFVLDLNEEFRKSNTNSKGIYSIRIAKFETIGLFGLISKALIAFGDEDELGLGFRIANILIRMEFQGQFSILRMKYL